MNFFFYRDKRGEIESADTMDETEKKDLEGGYETEYEEGILCFNRVWIFCSVYVRLVSVWVMSSRMVIYDLFLFQTHISNVFNGYDLFLFQTQNMIIFLHNTTHVQESNTQNITNKYIKLIAYISLNTRYQTT